MKAEPPLLITPDTRVAELLEHFPELEQELLDLSPAFRKLQNPVLRRTVARITTLRNAAKVGKIDLGVMINRLRKAAGQQEEFQKSDETTPGEESEGVPSWLVMDRVVKRIDVRSILDAGEKPAGKVLGELKQVPEGRICELTAPFLPAPLIDLAEQRGFESWSREESASITKVYFYRKQAEKEDELVELD